MPIPGKKTSTQVRNQRRKISKKRATQKNLPTDKGGIGSAQGDKTDLIPGALAPRVEQQLIGKMIGYDREVWPVTDAIKLKAVERTAKNIDEGDGLVSNLAVSNLIKMEEQRIKANAKVAPPVQPLTQVNVVNGQPSSLEPGFAAFLDQVVEFEQKAVAAQPARQSESERPAQSAALLGHDAGGDDAGPVADEALEFPGSGELPAGGEL